jgi:ubiquinone/menaquinone biosynthesis C-methylase UbiE
MKESNIERAVSAQTARRIYDFLGKSYDWLGAFDAQAKARSLELLGLASGEHVLEIGIGTGKVLAQIEADIQPGGICFGIDISTVMLSLSKHKNKSFLCQADARNFPFVSDCFDKVYLSFVLDLVPFTDIPGILTGILRMLRPGGQVVIVTLTEGVNFASRALIALWKAAYTISPVICAGCRPLQLTSMLEKAGFKQIQREVIIQLAVPSEISVATK